ncbi:MAG TPA: ribonuclease HII [Dinghuibacter sp.]|uniref:ribonuclease HII n=1 Tax=Dinghuibacter sp. TaxID=2024697 RepID=UPI002C971A5E|nr:ribonuclease HII [Dinghuibacter sp.]HTJ11834.1 ribonuclease HII [Dinghuibacter sp.]
MLRAYFHKKKIEAGLDEAGRGCLAGPVYAAAVILPKNFKHPLLNDSKQLSEAVRLELRPIIESKALAYAVARVDHDEIDRINILRASFKAMHLALDQLLLRPEVLLVDGNRFTPYQDISHHCIIEGDGIFASIAAASILAKTYRDEYMQELHREHPQYGWDQNKAYGTVAHRAAIARHGLTRYHRRSFTVTGPDGAPLLFEAPSGAPTPEVPPSAPALQAAETPLGVARETDVKIP